MTAMVEVVRNTNAEYHRDDGCVNNSGLQAFSKNAAVYHAIYVAKTKPREKPTRHMAIGSLTHSLVLEPDTTLEEYVKYPASLPLRGKIMQAWMAQHAVGRTILTAQEWRLAEAMTKKLRETPRACEIIDETGYTEISIYWDDPATGLRCKCRCDKLFLREGGHLLVDLKTTSQLTNFPDSIVRYGYAVQAAHYCAGVLAWTGKLPQFAFLIVEKCKEHLVGYREVGPQELAAAEAYRQFLLREFQRCRESGVWPDERIVEPVRANNVRNYSVAFDGALPL